MNRLTHDERRRLYQARRRASDVMLTEQLRHADVDKAIGGGSYGRTRVLQLVTLLMLLCGGFLAYRVVEFNPPASLIEAFLPRLY